MPESKDGVCHGYALWTALMAEVVGFSHVELILISPDQEPAQMKGAWAYHTAVKIDARVLDPYNRKDFKSESLWLNYTKETETSALAGNFSVILKAPLDHVAALYSEEPFVSPNDKKRHGSDQIYSFIMRLIPHMEKDSLQEHHAIGIGTNISFCRNPHFVAQMLTDLRSEKAPYSVATQAGLYCKLALIVMAIPVVLSAGPIFLYYNLSSE